MRRIDLQFALICLMIVIAALTAWRHPDDALADIMVPIAALVAFVWWRDRGRDRA